MRAVIAVAALASLAVAPYACDPEPPDLPDLPCTSGPCCTNFVCNAGAACNDGDGICTANYVNHLCSCQPVHDGDGGATNIPTDQGYAGSMRSIGPGGLGLLPGQTRTFQYVPPVVAVWRLPASMVSCSGALDPLVIPTQGSLLISATRPRNSANPVATFSLAAGQIGAPSFNAPCAGATGQNSISFTAFSGTFNVLTGAVEVQMQGHINNNLFPPGAALEFTASRSGTMDLQTGALSLDVESTFSDLY